MVKDKKVLVNLPLTDTEIFTHLIGGKEPAQRPVEMNYSEYKTIKNIATAGLVGVLIMSAALIKQEYGSFSNAYDSFMEQVEKMPSRMYGPY